MKDPRGRKPCLNKAQIKELKKLYNSGLPARQVGERMGVSKSTVSLYMRREHGPLRPPTRKPNKNLPTLARRAKELRASGVCWKLISRELGLSEDYLRKSVSRLDKGELE